MDRTLLLTISLIAAVLSGCATPGIQNNATVERKVDSLSERINELNQLVTATRAHIAAMDVTERTARDEVISGIEDVQAGIAGLPKRLEFACETPTTINTSCDNAALTRRIEVQSDKAVLGELERVVIEPPGHEFVARIDTGATSSSLHATDLVRMERDGEDWVRFNIESADGEPATVEAEVVRHVRVVQQADPDGSRRPVVNLRVRVGELDERVEFTLADRSHLDNTLILGRNFLTDLAVVDVARSFVQPSANQ